MAAHKQAQQLARQLFRLSLVDGQVSQDRVAGILSYIEKHRTNDALDVLRAYQRLIATEMAKGVAVVEHAGPIEPQTVQSIAASLSRKYNRPVRATTKENPSLLAGLRVRVGDDVYESSVAGQLHELSTAV